MIDYKPLYQLLRNEQADVWADSLPYALKQAFDDSRHGLLADWKQTLTEIPDLTPSIRTLQDEIVIGCQNDINEAERQQLLTALKKLIPWRKGPYQLYGIHLDTEWRSDWKWDRLKNKITPLKNRLVLDVGCGNGYHCWRMLGAGARMVVGIDPYLLNVMQFQAIAKLYGAAPVYVLPFGLEELPDNIAVFDTVFSMGVLYHRRSPIDHLLELKACLRPGGELVLETLVVEGDKNTALVPPGRYANMRNVWFLPSCDALTGWLERCGFANIVLQDITPTTIEEQRSTDWMPYHSLSNFLDDEHKDKTIEGLPAPVRAVFTAQKP